MKHIGPQVTWEPFLVVPAALTCASEHVYWYMFLMFLCFSLWITWIQLLSSLCMTLFLTGSWDSNRVIHSFEEGIEFNCPLGFELLPICIGHNNICIPMKEQIWAYVLPDSRTTNNIDLFWRITIQTTSSTISYIIIFVWKNLLTTLKRKKNRFYSPSWD